MCQVFFFFFGRGAVSRMLLTCLEFIVFLSQLQVCATMPRSTLWSHSNAELPWCRMKAHMRVGTLIGFRSFLNHQRISLDTDVLWNFIYFGSHLGRSLALVKSRHCTFIMKSDGVTMLLFLVLQLCKGWNPPPRGLACSFLLALYRPAWVAPRPPTPNFTDSMQVTFRRISPVWPFPVL